MIARQLIRSRASRRLGARALPAVLALIATAAPVRAENPNTEAAGQSAMTKAQADYATRSYGKALYRLGKAWRACGKSDCTDVTLASIFRDIGEIYVHTGDKKQAHAFFARALALQPALELNPFYDSPEVRAAWEEAGGGKKAEATPAPAPPAGPASLTHTPATEQRVDTPLPVYVEGAGANVVRVVVKYRGPSNAAGPWQEAPLERMGDGWGGMIPCADVRAGALRYYVEGVDAGGATVAVGASAEHPYEVPIRENVAAEPTHLPGQPPPSSCAPPPATPVAQAPPPEATPPSATPPPPPPPRGERPHRLWIGAAGTLDFLSIPSGDDLCLRSAATRRPVNANNLYCTTLDGTDFPPASVINGTMGDIVPGQGRGGHAGGSLQLGNVRYLLAVDYAITQHVLVGARFGGVANRYPGNDAVHDGRAFGPPIHAELRATLLFGHSPLMGTRLSPMVFVAGGISEFDARVQSTVQITQGTPPNQTALPVPVDIWRTDGPGFVAAGLGARLTIQGRFAIAAAARGNLAFGGNGVLPVFGPELTAQVGF